MTRVNYTYSPNGKVQIFVACSKHPFKIENDEDIGNLFSFVGQIRDRMLQHLHDPHERSSTGNEMASGWVRLTQRHQDR